jgi:regulator of protease activity HflC (stomatin/prohibitin superfamily)
MTGEKDKALQGPLAQSIDIGFRAARLAIAILALGWATMNVREVPPDMQAVVTRFGATDRVQQAGLIVAWPRPFERVLLTSGPAQQMTQHIEVNAVAAAGLDRMISISDAPKTAGLYLTGDGGVVLLDATLTWRVADAAAYVVAEPHVAPALRRLAEGAAAAIAAARPLDDFVVARPEAADPRAQAARAALRAAYAGEVNRRLDALEASGGGLGIEVTRADLSAFLPAAAKAAFDQAGAEAAAPERTAEAHARTAEIESLAASAEPGARPALIERIYRQRIGAILHSAGAVTAIDARGGSRVILPGGGP